MDNIVQLKQFPSKIFDQQDLFSKLLKIEFQLLKLSNSIQQQEGKKVSITNSDGIHFFYLSEIIHLEASSNYTKISIDKRSAILVSKTLKYFTSILPATQFIRTHQSHIINQNHIVKISKRDGGSITLKNNKVVPIARSARQGIFKKLQILNPSLSL